MKIIVNAHKCEIDKSPVNEQEINITKCEFEFAEEITNEYVKEAYFTLNGATYKQIIVNNECDIPSEVLEKKGQIVLGVVCYLVENEQEIKRYNPSPCYFTTLVGSLKDAENTEPITPSEMEQYEQALNNGLNDIDYALTDLQEKVDSDYFKGDKGDTGNPGQDGVSPTVVMSKSGTTTTLIITDKNGEHTSLINDGNNGVNGADGFSPSASVSKSGSITTITITDKNGTTESTINDGETGAAGRDGYVQYTAGDNITIENNVISADVPSVNLDVYYIDDNNQNNPFVFSEHETGIYIFKVNDKITGLTTIYLRANNQTQTYSSIDCSGLNFLVYYTKVDENIVNNTPIAYLVFPSLLRTRDLSFAPNVFVYSTANVDYGYLSRTSYSGQSIQICNLNTAQTITGEKTFSVIPKQSTTTAPTQDAQFSNKKYVDDQISNAVGNINTILATLTTPSGNGGN